MDFTVKMTGHAIRGTVPTDLLSTEKKISHLLPANGHTNITWPAPSRGKWAVGGNRLLVEVKSDRDKNAQNNTQYSVFKAAPAIRTASRSSPPTEVKSLQGSRL